MNFYYLTAALLITFSLVTNVLAKHDKSNVVNVELDIPKILNNILKTKGLKITPSMDGGKMRTDSDDYVLKVKIPHFATIARMFLESRRFNFLAEV